MPKPILGILAALYKSRWLQNSGSFFSGVSLPSDAAPAPTADHASHHVEPWTKVAHSTPIDGSGWGYVVANGDRFHFDFSSQAEQGIATGAASARALNFGNVSDAFPNDVPLSSGDIVAIPHGAGSLFAGADGAMHVGNASALVVNDTAPIGTPALAVNAAVSSVDFGGASLAPQNAVVAFVSNAPTTEPSAAYIIDGVIHDPGTFLSTPVDDSGLSVNGSGIRVGVLSDSFNNLGGAAADEADGALPCASNVNVIEDLALGGTDEGARRCRSSTRSRRVPVSRFIPRSTASRTLSTATSGISTNHFFRIASSRTSDPDRRGRWP